MICARRSSSTKFPGHCIRSHLKMAVNINRIAAPEQGSDGGVGVAEGVTGTAGVGVSVENSAGVEVSVMEGVNVNRGDAVTVGDCVSTGIGELVGTGGTPLNS